MDEAFPASILLRLYLFNLVKEETQTTVAANTGLYVEWLRSCLQADYELKLSLCFTGRLRLLIQAYDHQEIVSQLC